MRKQVQITLESGGAPRPRTKDIPWKGLNIRVYSVGWLSYLALISVETVYDWEEKEILPKPVFKLLGNVRWYTPAELILYSKLIRQHYQGGRDLKALKTNFIQAERTVRQRYLNLQPGDKLDRAFVVLADEEAITRQITDSKLKKTLNKESFNEVVGMLNESQSAKTETQKRGR